MSGIVGIFLRDGRDASTRDVERALAALAARGPDSSRLWCDGPTAFACAQNRVSPASLRERQPHEERDHGLTVVHDARLDNRDDLARELLSPSGSLDDVGDGELLLAAWRRWGERCPERLLGDFAFAIWDARRRSLFLARDPVGMRLLYWFESSRLVAFASRIGGLVELPEVPRRLDPAQVADYMAGAFCDPSRTFHAGIARLLPAQSLYCTAEATRARRYFELTLPDDTHRGSPGDVAAGFRAVLDVAVRDRLRAVRPAGSLLSGGLDSSAIVCLARARRREEGAAPLPTFSLRFPGVVTADEGRFIAALTDRGGLDYRTIDGGAIGPLAGNQPILAAIDEPFFGGTFPYQWGVYRAVREHGVGVLLDGNGGDAVVCHGYYFLADLLRRLRLLRLAREIEGLTRSFGLTKWQFLSRFALTPSVPAWARRLRRAIIGRAPELPQPSLVAPELIERTRLRERFTEHWHRREPPRGDRDSHLATILDSLPTDAVENAAASFAVEQRCPYFDLRVIDYCLRVPSEQKIEDGLTRMLTRRALADLLPPLIANRRGKAVATVSLTRGLFGRDRDALVELLTGGESDRYAGYLDMDGLRRLLRRHLALPHGDGQAEPPAAAWLEIEQLRKAAVLLQWLRQSGIPE